MNANAVGSNTSKVREAMEHGMSLRMWDLLTDSPTIGSKNLALKTKRRMFAPKLPKKTK